MVAFATEDGLRYLASSDTWFMDVAFSSSLALVEQLFVVRAHLVESAVSVSRRHVLHAGSVSRGQVKVNLNVYPHASCYSRQPNV